MNNKFNTYQNGLRVGDLVTYDRFLFGKRFRSTSGCFFESIVLTKKHLFNKETRWGIKGFFEYEVLNLNEKSREKFSTINTKNITIKKVISTKH